MTKQIKSEQTIGNLTRGQLEEIITEVARQTFQQVMKNEQENKAQALAATFGTWEDEREDTAIINEIYNSRNNNLTSG